jgi:RNA polymerase sigma-70 factor (ECF subfamily)
MDCAVLDEMAIRAAAGDREAFNAVVAESLPELRLFIAARAYSAELVEEVLQSTYIACFESLPRYQPRGTLLPWLKGIAHNLLRRELAARARHQRLDALDLVLASESANQAVDAGPADQDLLATLKRCLARLGPQARELLALRHEQGVPLDEIANRYARTRDAVASMLKRVRESVRDCMAAAGSAGA